MSRTALTIVCGVMPCFGVVRHLNAAAAVRLVDSALHRAGDRLGVHYYLALRISRGSADRLYKRGLGAQQALLVRIEYRDERYLGDIKSLAQQIYAYEHIKQPEPQIADYLHTLDGLDIVVNIFYADEILRKKTR